MSNKFAYINMSSTSLHMCIDFVLFFLEVGKNPLMTVNKVRHSLFSYQIFTMQLKAAMHVCCAQGHRLFAKKEQRHVRYPTFFTHCGVELGKSALFQVRIKKIFLNTLERGSLSRNISTQKNIIRDGIFPISSL